MQLDKVSEDFVDVIRRVRPLGMARNNLGDLPRRQITVNLFGELLAFLGQLVDFGRNINGGLGLHVTQLFNFVFEISNGLLKIEECFLQPTF